MYHLDLSIWAFEKLSDTKWGVIGTTWRDVPCWHRPSKWARVPSWKKPTPGERPPQGFQRSQDKRPKVRARCRHCINPAVPECVVCILWPSCCMLTHP